MTVDTAKHRFEYGGQTHYFCAAGCETKFEANPEKYLNKKAPPPSLADLPAGTVYTCPMHPEIRQIGPGSCPICGMALEPETVALNAPPNPELADMTRRFWVGAVLALPAVILEMFECGATTKSCDRTQYGKERRPGFQRKQMGQ
jgi:Cu+-exporting ATPase